MLNFKQTRIKIFGILNFRSMLKADLNYLSFVQHIFELKLLNDKCQDYGEGAQIDNCPPRTTYDSKTRAICQDKSQIKLL